MDRQHKRIKGYNDLSQTQIDLMNEIKAHGERLEQLIVSLEKGGTSDKRWLAIAKTDLQKGVMALVRAVAKPSSF